MSTLAVEQWLTKFSQRVMSFQFRLQAGQLKKEGRGMRRILFSGVLAMVVGLAFGLTARAQGGPPRGAEVPLITPGPGWGPCPRCENEGRIAADRKKAEVDTRPFDPRDLSGIWGNFGEQLDFKARPPLTAYGKRLNEKLQKTLKPGGSDEPQYGYEGLHDPFGTCDPIGYPGSLEYNYGMEFVQVPGRAFQFFEIGHTWRTIWTDGRKLPPDPPIYRFMGYAVGHWEGNAFVVESNGYDERALIGGSPGASRFLYPHTSEERIVERYTRKNYGLLEYSITIIDPKVFTAPWTSTGTVKLSPRAEMGEDFCVPSDAINFNQTQTERAK
jgi:hypothetical protein